VRLHVLSDLHLEHAPFTDPAPDAELLVLDGDISLGTRGVEWARHWAAGRPALYVAGNHEFYGQSFPDLVADLRTAAAGSSLHVLERDELVLDGVRFLGCTLWSDFQFGGREHRADSMRISERLVNDYRVVRHGPSGRTLAARDTLDYHQASREWLADRLAQPHEGPTVVITHHAPVIVTMPKEAVFRALGGAFSSDLTELMGDERVGLWIYGHTHRAADFVVRGTRLISNPRGYPHEPVAGFDPSRVIDVPSERQIQAAPPLGAASRRDQSVTG
jgi:predicted phosphohydrolase